jgi:hypothetical protein
MTTFTVPSRWFRLWPFHDAAVAQFGRVLAGLARLT